MTNDQGLATLYSLSNTEPDAPSSGVALEEPRRLARGTRSPVGTDAMAPLARGSSPALPLPEAIASPDAATRPYIDVLLPPLDESAPEPVVPEVSRKIRSRGRRTRPRSQTIATRRLTRAELAVGAALYPAIDTDADRPRTRAECAGHEGPCPWVACKHHLYLDINPVSGSIKLNFPDLEPWELEDSCALDVAERGASTLEEVGRVTNLTRERIRQLEVRGLHKLKACSTPEAPGVKLAKMRY